MSLIDNIIYDLDTTQGMTMEGFDNSFPSLEEIQWDMRENLDNSAAIRAIGGLGELGKGLGVSPP